MTNPMASGFFLCWWKSSLARHASSPSSLFKGHKIPFNAAAALCQVTWNFQLKSISALGSVCVCAQWYPRRPKGILSDTAPAFCLCDVLWMLRAIAGAVFQAQMMKSIELFFSRLPIAQGLHAVVLLKRSVPFELSEHMKGFCCFFLICHIKEEWCSIYVHILLEVFDWSVSSIITIDGWVNMWPNCSAEKRKP